MPRNAILYGVFEFPAGSLARYIGAAFERPEEWSPGVLMRRCRSSAGAALLANYMNRSAQASAAGRRPIASDIALAERDLLADALGVS